MEIFISIRMNNLKKIKQFGEKSFFINENTGSIHIHSPQGTVIINSYFTENGIKQLLSEVGHKRNLDELLKLINHLPHELTLPPVRPDVFIGRDKDLEDLRKEILNGDSLLLLVNGQC